MLGTRWLVLIACSSIVIAGCAGDSSAPKTEPSKGHVVAGRLVDENQLPVAGAMLVLTQRADNAPIARTNSTPDGQFSFGVVATGTYVVSVEAAGFEPLLRNLDVIEGNQEFLRSITYTLSPVAVVEAYYEIIPKVLQIQYALAYAINGDFNQGCMQPSYTCNAFTYPYPNAAFEARDPKQTPWMGVVFEESWTSTSPVCAKAVAVDLYNPDAPNIQDPNGTNPHYWTNYPSSKWKISSPIRMVIPRNATDDPDALDADWRVKANGGKMLARGNWTVRNFPPGKGLTNLALDINCFTDQKFELLWTNFYLNPAPVDFSARPT